MKKRVILTLLLLLAALTGTAWAADNGEAVCYDRAELFQRGSMEARDTVSDDLGLLDAGQPLADVLAAGMAEKKDKIDVSAFNLIVDVVEDEKGNSAWVGENADKLRDAYAQAVNSHPELVYVLSGYKMSGSPQGNQIKITTVRPQYDSYFTDERMAQFDQAVDEALGLVSETSLSDLEKALILHDYLVEQVTYNWEVDIALKTGESMKTVEQRTGTRIYTAYGALVEGDAVCQGYALAYKLLLDKCGIDSVLVTSNEMGHAWNLVKLDGSWYHVDVTWDDPTPDLPGYCGHDNFLRSNSGIEAEGHYGWTTPTGITVSEGSEPEGLFRVTNNRMYYYEGNYYYLTITQGQGTLWRANALINTAPVELEDGLFLFYHVFDGRYYNQYGVVWHERELYYVNNNKRLICYDLTAGDLAEIGTVPFEAEDSKDEMYYDSKYDTIGLCYDGSTGEIVAVSKTRPGTVLARVQIKEYPVLWDQLPTNETNLAGGVQKENDTLQVGLVWAEQGETANLLAAFYDEDGRLLKVQMVSSDRWTQGLNVLVLDLEGYPDYDRVTLFLLSDDSVPYCETKNAA